MSDVQIRPWGHWQVLTTDEPSRKTVKLLTVNAGGMLSLQSHRQRREIWQPLGSGLVVYMYEPSSIPDIALGGTVQAFPLEAHKVYEIPMRWVHRLMNPTAAPISVVETIVGRYDENDIIRYHDAYGRD